jgi:hypothetical protein
MKAALLFALLAGTAVGAPLVTITAPPTVTAGQAGYAASVPAQVGVTYAWTVSNGAIMVGAATESVAFSAGASGSVALTCRATDAGGVSMTGTLSIPITPAAPPAFNLAQALTDGAQRTTLAFDGLGMVTGNLQAQSFFPPGKVADYWGFQYLRDNDPDDMGHNTSFLTRAACDVLSILTAEQLGWLKALAAAQVEPINRYAYGRYPLMKAFRRLVDGDLPPGTTGLDVAAVKAASRELYVLDGQLSYDRAAAYARIYRSLTASQKAYLSAMAGKGWASWPPRTMDDVRGATQGLTNDEVVAVTTYAGDLFSWYVGSLAGDVYFCPERHGTYFGSFYMKDAPAIGHEGYSIDEQLTVTAGSALCDASKGYVTAEQAAIVSALADAQRSALYAGTPSIVSARTAISAALRSLISSAEPTAGQLSAVKATVLEQSAIYGELDGANVAAYATAFARLAATLTSVQKDRLLALRRSFMSGRYADGTAFDFTTCDTYYLYAAPADAVTLAPYVADSARFFATAAPAYVAAWILPSAAHAAGTGGAFYTTDLTIVNAGVVDATLALKFLGHDADGRTGPEKTYALAAGKAVTYADVLGSVFGVSSGWGAVRVASTVASLAVSSQTSTPAPAGGTFGQSVPACGSADLVGTGVTRSIAPVREDAAFRTNLVLANATEAALDVDVSLVSAAGATITAKRYTLYPLGMTQVTRIVRDLGVAADVAGARLVLSTPTPGGALAAYASVLDATTNDPRALLPR